MIVQTGEKLRSFADRRDSPSPTPNLIISFVVLDDCIPLTGLMSPSLVRNAVDFNDVSIRQLKENGGIDRMFVSVHKFTCCNEEG